MFTRVIVKGLPGNCTEAKLRSVFGEFGEITDCSLKYTKEGKFRRFAFVGFGDGDAAGKVLKHFSGTHIGSSRITVLLFFRLFLCEGLELKIQFGFVLSCSFNFLLMCFFRKWEGGANKGCGWKKMLEERDWKFFVMSGPGGAIRTCRCDFTVRILLGGRVCAVWR